MRPCGYGHALVLALAWACLLWVGAGARAQTIESVLRQGEVIAGHAKWEDDCAQCHVRFDRAAQDRLCMSCHKDVGQDVREKTGYHGRLRPAAGQPQGQMPTCRSCHTDHRGRQARIVNLDKASFDHTATDYVLRGKHVKVECASCHVPGKKYSQAPQDCLSCHRKDDTHKGTLGTACADCHVEESWKQSKFDHGKTRFALTGKHAQAKCEICHRDGKTKDLPRACVSCHREDDRRAHKGQYGERCDSCHDTRAWKPASFSHDTATRFALRGKHRSAKCADCHGGPPVGGATGPVFQTGRDKPGSACIDCHRKDDQHKGTLGTECGACHTERDWKERGRFDHDKTAFALRGRHREAKCDSCHKSANHKEAPKDCIGCHRSDDKHKGTLGTECAACHTERNWKERSRFDHDKTAFALRGRHREATCESCHKSANPKETPKDCIGCHRADDKHKGTLGTACGDCHAERDWKSAPGFDHARTKFPLRHAHAVPPLACKSCHIDVQHLRSTALDCHACHKKNDKHEGQLGTRCESCHDERSWKVANFDHTRTRFALIGRHMQLACKDCHTMPRYRDAARECVGCHLKDDKHQTRFGTDCQSCHNTRHWGLWSFEHTKRTRFVLEGTHASAPCERCHTQPAPKGKLAAVLSTTCISCHRRDDVHDGAFGTACEQCHTTERWKQVRPRAGRPEPPTTEGRRP